MSWFRREPEIREHWEPTGRTRDIVEERTEAGWERVVVEYEYAEVYSGVTAWQDHGTRFFERRAPGEWRPPAKPHEG